MKKTKHLTYILLYISIIGITGCKKFIDVEAPLNTVNEENVYQTDASAIAVLSGVYANLSIEENKMRDPGNGPTLLSYVPALSADELTLTGSTRADLNAYYKNALTATAVGDNGFWKRTFFYVYTANSAIAGLATNKSLTPTVKNQLIGEAYFIRAFCYFYLVNLYGKVPIVTGTDYQTNSLLTRSEVSDVYALIKEDFLKAQNLLSDQFSDVTLLASTTERIRPSKDAATAMLARMYLYTGDWAKAETESSKIIDKSGIYSPVSLNSVFLKNSKETIWALQSVGTGQSSNTGSGRLFVLPITGTNGLTYPVYLSNLLVNQFEANDPRLNSWVKTVTVGGTVYPYPYKYKVGNVATVTTEYQIVLRLAEQYLIRAEARAKQSNIRGAVEDLNVIRTRARGSAGDDVVPNLLPTITQDQAIAAVMHERRVELFTEWGHRWLDLKRTGTVDAVMQSVTQAKGGVWKSSQALYPIPLSEIRTNPNLVQNPDYQ